MRYQSARRRVGLTRQGAILLVLVAAFTGLAPSSPVTRSDSAYAVGTDDYPSRLKSAVQDSLVDPWNFYNRECTSFVAWRLNHNAGLAFHNYYLGVHWGDAANWRNAANQVGVPVDNNPERGAVAWWSAGSAGSSHGHVAWVSGMTSTSITIEEYNYLSRGHYDQRTISEGSSSWPSAFIHVGGQTLRNIASPSVVGTPKVASKISARPGSWSPSGATYTYQWLADGVPVSEATHRSFAPRAAQLGKRLQVRVTAASGRLGKTSVTSARTAAVARGDMNVLRRPTVTGTPEVGVKLMSDPGRWSPTPSRYRYQWLADGRPVDGATYRGFIPRAEQLGKTIQVEVTATATAMELRTASSFRTQDVSPGELVMSSRPRITGTPQVDTQLSATGGSWTPSAGFDYQWFADGDPVAGATRSTFTPTADQLGEEISVNVRATRDGYTTEKAWSVRTAAVAPATFATTGPPQIAGTAQVDRALTASAGPWSPTGTASYQWFVAGVRVAAGTHRSYTPNADDLRKQVTVKVTMTRPGYVTASSASAATAAVLPGSFANASDPSVTGTPRVGLQLTAHPGSWSPEPTLSYQWYADGSPIRDATGGTFTPRAGQLAKHITVQVTARRPGYLTALAESAPTVRVAPGTITSIDRPTTSGTPVVGKRVTATAGTWSIRPTTVAYQWYAAGAPISGATSSSYVPTRADLDHRLTVHVTVSSGGYDPESAGSPATTPVVLGRVQFDEPPTLTGTPVVGHVLTVHPGSFAPGKATPTYTWWRGGEPIVRATARTYELVPADVGHRVAVIETVFAPHWTSSSARLVTASVVKSVPTLQAHSRVIGHRVLFRFTTPAPGLPDPRGKVIATEHGQKIGVASILDGHGRLTLADVASGVHHYVFSYTGPLQVPARLRMDVTVP